MMISTLLDRVQAFLTEHGLLQPELCLLVAVSGGPDSLCLLHVLCHLRQRGGPALHVAHLDHGFRADESAAEAAFVARIAAEWQVPATVERFDVPALARTMGRNKQATARAVRYAFLARTALAMRCTAVAVAHQADDQAETVLLHLLHGAGPAGLRGMRPVLPWVEWNACLPGDDPVCQLAAALNPRLIRPLLDTRREEIENYCIVHDVHPCLDPSNRLAHYTRNRIRAELLPHLEEYNQQIVTALRRTAQICADDYAYIQEQLDRLWPELVSSFPEGVRFSTYQWLQLVPTLQRYALRRAAALLAGSDALSFDQVEAGRFATTRRAGYQHALAMGLWLYVTDDSFVLTSRLIKAGDLALVSVLPDLPQLAVEHLPVALPGTTAISATWQVETRYLAHVLPESPDGKQSWRWQINLDADVLDAPLWMRRRRAGDRFRPAGGRGSRRLQDFFVDAKLPRELRTAWPILATTTRIVWVAGMRADARFQASADTRRILWVSLSKRRT